MAGVTGQGLALEQRLGGAIDKAHANAECNASWGKKETARDDSASPAGAPQAVREGSPFAAGGMEAKERESPSGGERILRTERSFPGGLGCGFTPGCGLAHQVAVEAKLLNRGDANNPLG